MLHPISQRRDIYTKLLGGELGFVFTWMSPPLKPLKQGSKNHLLRSFVFVDQVFEQYYTINDAYTQTRTDGGVVGVEAAITTICGTGVVESDVPVDEEDGDPCLYMTQDYRVSEVQDVEQLEANRIVSVLCSLMELLTSLALISPMDIILWWWSQLTIKNR